ncbi:MAG: response regulator, partial [Acidobacteria bacterium]|nr:response regulator [Acidobacteriota bacterium]
MVLVVDDEPGVRELARRILESSGYGVLEAGDGQQALDVFASNVRVDFLMADLDMPVMRGEELAARMRILRPELRVLYVTAHSGALFRERPELLDGEAFLDKPFTVAGLLEAVSLLNRPRRTRRHWRACGARLSGKSCRDDSPDLSGRSVL